MLKAILLILLLCTMSVNNSFAGFLVKKQAAANTITTAHGNVYMPHAPAKLHTLLRPRHHGELPKGIYIAFCILPLGWLAIAINENFTQQTWIFSLLLYMLLYIPGLIYSLMQMHKYYS